MKQFEAFLNVARSLVNDPNAHEKVVNTYCAIRPMPAGYRLTFNDPWCAATVSAAAQLAGLTSVVFPECSCERMIALYRARGQWCENEGIVPPVGAIIMYDWQDNGAGDCKGQADHVGIVEKVENGIITVIEGNMNNKMGRRKLAVGGRYIRGYCLPAFDGKMTAQTQTKWEKLKQTVQQKYGFAEGTMDYLCQYKYAEDLLKRLAETK